MQKDLEGVDSDLKIWIISTLELVRYEKNYFAILVCNFCHFIFCFCASIMVIVYGRNYMIIHSVVLEILWGYGLQHTKKSLCYTSSHLVRSVLTSLASFQMTLFMKLSCLSLVIVKTYFKSFQNMHQRHNFVFVIATYSNELTPYASLTTYTPYHLHTLPFCARIGSLILQNCDIYHPNSPKSIFGL